MIDFFDLVCLCLSLLGVINMVMADETIPLKCNSIAGKPVNYNISVWLGSVISVGIIVVAAIVIVEIFMKNAFQIDKKSRAIG